MLTALTPVSNTLLHGCTPPLAPHYAAPLSYNPLFALRSLHKLSATQHANLPCHYCPSRAIRWPDMLRVSNLQRSSRQCWMSLECSISSYGRFWYTGSLDVRGFADLQTTRCCCRLLQYFYTFPHKRNDIRKKVTERIMCVLIFSTTFIWSISRYNKKSARYYHKCT
jgi:hypothetical protein